MSTDGPQQGCRRCLRRSWLLARLGPALDRRCGDRARLFELLELTDEELLQALAGRRRAELVSAYARFTPAQAPHPPGTGSTCRHLRAGAGAPALSSAVPALYFTGGVERLKGLSQTPIVAILGTPRASDYGIRAARSIARGLAAAGIAVAAGVADAIAVAAHRGALELNAPTLAVLGGGLDLAPRPGRLAVCNHVRRHGCVVSELPGGCAPRRWSLAACERIPVQLAALTVVVEAGERQHELAAARLAQALGRPLAAVPGRVSSPASQGTHALLIAGASLVRGAGDVLELLGRTPSIGALPGTAAGLPPRLRKTFERVALGCDTPERLAQSSVGEAGILLALSELELLGALGRGDGGRYVPHHE